MYQQPRPLKFRHAEVQSDCRASSRALDHISPAPLPSPVSGRCPCNGVKGVKRFPHSLTDAINAALAHSADGKIPNNFITISLVSFRSQSLQAYYWKKNVLIESNSKVGALPQTTDPTPWFINLPCQRATAPSAKYLPYSKLSMTRWIRPWWLRARGGSRVVWEKTLLASQPAGYSSAFLSMDVQSIRMSFSALNVHSTWQWRVWIRGIRTWANAAGSSRPIMWKVVTWLAVVFNQAISDLLLGPETHFAAKQIMSNSAALRLLSRLGPGAGKREGEQPLESGLLWKPDHSAAAD